MTDQHQQKFIALFLVRRCTSILRVTTGRGGVRVVDEFLDENWPPFLEGKLFAHLEIVGIDIVEFRNRVIGEDLTREVSQARTGDTANLRR